MSPTSFAELGEPQKAALSGSRLVNTEALIAEISDGVTLSTVAEHLGIELQASGGQWRSLCPLHEENTPSCYFSDPKDLYYCYGCKEGGNTIDLVERVRHVGFIEALYWLAAEADVDIGNYERPMSEAERVQEELRHWCEEWLGGGQVVPNRVPLDVGTKFEVGKRQSKEYRPAYFKGKSWMLEGVILPWRMPSGRLVGWRVRPTTGTKKTIGTPSDFPLGKITEQTLFGIQVAREHIGSGVLILVEGEYDCMALHAAGIRNVVAMGGSSLTDGQMKLIESLHVREIVVLLDGDEGGFAAAKVLAEKYWAHDQVCVRVQECAADADPEDVIKDMGAWYVSSLVQGAVSALEYLLRREWGAKGRDTLTEKLEFVKWIRDTYGAKLRSTDESLVLAEVAKWLQIPELEVRDYVRAADGSLSAVDSERLLIGKACRDKRFFVHLRSRLARDDLFVLKHQRVWDLLSDMLLDGQDYDPITLAQRAQSHGIPEGYIEGCLELPDSNLEYHIKTVADLALRRAARDDAVVFRDRISDLTQPANLLVGDLTTRITSKALKSAGATQKQLSEQVDEAMDTLHDRMTNESEIWGLDLGTQFPQLSRWLQGLQPGRLYQIAAVSRIGKTTLLTQWAASIGVHQSIPIDFISLEMDETEILFKIASHMTGIDSMKISGGRLEPDEAKTVEFAMLRIRNSPLHIWAPDGMTTTEFLLYSRESVMQRRTEAFFVDYVQLIDPEAGQERDNGYKLYGDFARMAKMKVARSMNVAVVCAAQLARAAAQKERPTSEDMGDSYALVRHSNVVVILHGQEDSATVDLHLDKNRGGSGGGLLPMIYNKPNQTFREASGGSKQPDYLVRI